MDAKRMLYELQSLRQTVDNATKQIDYLIGIIMTTSPSDFNMEPVSPLSVVVTVEQEERSSVSSKKYTEESIQNPKRSESLQVRSPMGRRDSVGNQKEKAIMNDSFSMDIPQIGKSSKPNSSKSFRASDEKININWETSSMVSISNDNLNDRSSPAKSRLHKLKTEAGEYKIKNSVSTTSLSLAAKRVSNKIIENGKKSLFQPGFDEHGSKSSGLNIHFGKRLFGSSDSQTWHFQGIHPLSSFIVLWDAMMAVILLIVAFWVPFVPARFKSTEPYLIYCSITCTIIFTLDTAVQFLTVRKRYIRQTPAISPDGSNLEPEISPDGESPSTIKESPITRYNEKKELTKSQLGYLKSWFFVDIITCLPLDLIPFPNSDFMVFLRILRLHHFWHIMKVNPRIQWLRRGITRNFGLNDSFQTIFVLFGLMIYYLHVHASFVFILGRITNYVNWDGTSSSMLNYEWIRRLSPGGQYTHALVIAWGNTFSMGTKPPTVVEQWVYMILVFIGASIYATIFGFMSAFSFGIDASARVYKSKMDEVHEYMNEKGMGPQLQRKIRHYFDLKYKGKYFQEENILSEFNQSLRQEIAANNLRHIINQVPFLRRNTGDGRDEEYLGRLCTSLRECFYVRGDIVTKQGEWGTAMYFIYSGSLAVIVNGKQVGTLNEGAFFGEIGLIVQIPRQATVQAIRSCHLYRLDRESILPILEDFDDVRLKVSEIYRERIMKIQKDKDLKDDLKKEAENIEKERREKMKIQWE
ncbi:anaphase-promoting complex subunit Hcn1 [Nowakowskiella sp. JEL0407]|nr:anaphase-promoting complex subunit Hcn1 [Nowakowskiella sp. JEL0407]